MTSRHILFFLIRRNTIPFQVLMLQQLHSGNALLAMSTSKEVTTRFTRSRAKMKTSETFLLRGIIVYQWNPSHNHGVLGLSRRAAGSICWPCRLLNSQRGETLKTVGILQVSKDVLTRALRSNLQSWTLNLTIVMQG